MVIPAGLCVMVKCGGSSLVAAGEASNGPNSEGSLAATSVCAEESESRANTLVCGASVAVRTASRKTAKKEGIIVRQFIASSAVEEWTSSALWFLPGSKNATGQAGVYSFTSFASHAVHTDRLRIQVI